MRENQIAAQGYVQAQSLNLGGLAVREDITVRQNIDAKIEAHKSAITELEEAKSQLSPLLDMRLDLLAKAMQFGRF